MPHPTLRRYAAPAVFLIELAVLVALVGLALIGLATGDTFAYVIPLALQVGVVITVRRLSPLSYMLLTVETIYLLGIVFVVMMLGGLQPNHPDVAFVAWFTGGACLRSVVSLFGIFIARRGRLLEGPILRHHTSGT